MLHCLQLKINFHIVFQTLHADKITLWNFKILKIFQESYSYYSKVKLNQ